MLQLGDWHVQRLERLVDQLNQLNSARPLGVALAAQLWPMGRLSDAGHPEGVDVWHLLAGLGDDIFSSCSMWSTTLCGVSKEQLTRVSSPVPR